MLEWRVGVAGRRTWGRVRVAVSAVYCVRLTNHRFVPVKQIIHDMLIILKDCCIKKGSKVSVIKINVLMQYFTKSKLMQKSMVGRISK